MLGVSQGQIVKFKQQVDRMTAKAKAVMQKADAAVATVITTSEVSAASFLEGVIHYAVAFFYWVKRSSPRPHSNRGDRQSEPVGNLFDCQ